MIAILGGLGAAVAWAVSTLSTSRSSKMIPPASVLAGVMLVGSVASAPFAAAVGRPTQIEGDVAMWLLVASSANLAGLLFAYSSLRIGKVGLVSPITSAQGAVAALIAVLAGEQLSPGAGAMLALIVIGVALASLSRAPDGTRSEHEARGAVLAGCAAALFGLGLYSLGRLSGELPIAWIILLSRLLGVAVLLVPLGVAGKLRMTRAAAPYVLLSGVCEVIGLVSFTIGSRGAIAVTAVLGSQFAAIAAVAAYFLFGERLRRVQVVGVSAILVGVAVLTALQT